MSWRDAPRIWALAWLCLPLAVGADLALGRSAEGSARLVLQAVAHAEAGDWPEARRRFEDAARADSRAVLPAHNAAVACLRTGDVAAALAWNRETLRRSPSFAPARSLHREIRLQQERRRRTAG